MQMKLDQWCEFLSIDERVSDTLREFLPLIEAHIDQILDVLYARLRASAVSAQAFGSDETLARARRSQKEHWLKHVFAGNFDDNYLEAARRIGRAHHQLGVDLRLYMGAYAIVLNELTRIVQTAIPDCGVTRLSYLNAVTNVVFMDMGLATYVYYDTMLSHVEEMAHQLNMSLARAGEYRDNETGEHIVRMGRMCEAVALAYGKDARWAEMLRVASPLHDVGKIGVPDSILLKPGRLTTDEMDVMRQHPEIGGDIIPEHPAEVIGMARRIALTHHEKWDGSGYPIGLRGSEIPLEGRIAAICDVYDALISKRPYKPAWTTEKAIGHIVASSGTHFDPEVVRSFLACLTSIDEIQRMYVDGDGGDAQPEAGAVCC
jgi:putative two-component system response regulator